MTDSEATEIIEDVLDALVEVGNGTTDEMLKEAASKLFKFRDGYLSGIGELRLNLAEVVRERDALENERGEWCSKSRQERDDALSALAQANEEIRKYRIVCDPDAGFGTELIDRAEKAEAELAERNAEIARLQADMADRIPVWEEYQSRLSVAVKAGKAIRDNFVAYMGAVDAGDWSDGEAKGHIAAFDTAISKLSSPSPGMKCCERDHNSDGDCDRHPIRHSTEPLHSCGPESNCDTDCLDRAAFASLESRLSAAVEAVKASKELRDHSCEQCRLAMRQAKDLCPEYFRLATLAEQTSFAVLSKEK